MAALISNEKGLAFFLMKLFFSSEKRARLSTGTGNASYNWWCLILASRPFFSCLLFCSSYKMFSSYVCIQIYLLRIMSLRSLNPKVFSAQPQLKRLLYYIINYGIIIPVRSSDGFESRFQIPKKIGNIFFSNFFFVQKRTRVKNLQPASIRWNAFDKRNLQV